MTEPRGALLEGDKRYAYDDMLRIADGIAAGVEPRSVVLLVARNTVASISAYVGFLRRRAVPLMVGDSIAPERLSALIESYTPEYIWAPSSFFPGTASGEGYVPSEVSFGDYALLRRRNLTQSEEWRDAVYSETALLLTTSGSTGTPKLVRLSYDNLQSNARSIAEYQGLSGDDCAITTLPLSYSYGISIVNSHLLSGSSLVLTEASVLDKRFWALVREHPVSNFGGVPYTYQMIARLGVDRLPLGELRFVSQAGGRLDPWLQGQLAEQLARVGTELFVMYGQTEATARMAWLPPACAAEKLGSIGVAIPGGSFEIHDASGDLIEEAGVDGELVYRGANVCLGYAQRRDDLARGDENNGVLRTGDVARRDDDGFYYITGRTKRFVKLFGNRVSLDEVEALLGEGGVTAACLGDDEMLAVFAEGADEDAVRKIIRSQTSINDRSVRVVIQEIPRKENGKIDYASLGKL